MPLVLTPFANFSVSNSLLFFDTRILSICLLCHLLLLNLQIAAGSGVYNVPYVTDVRKIFSTILSVYRPLFPKIVMIFTFHALLAGFITHLEIKSFLRVLDLQYLMKEEKRIS